MTQIEHRVRAFAEFIADEAVCFTPDGAIRKLAVVPYDPKEYAHIVHLPFNPQAPLLMLMQAFTGVLRPWLLGATVTAELELPQTGRAACLVRGPLSGLIVRGVVSADGYGQLSAFIRG